MLDFLIISTRSKKPGIIEIYPKFIYKKSADLMIRGGDFYAIWDEERGIWSTDEDDVVRLIDAELEKFAEQYKKNSVEHIKVLYLWDVETGMIDAWHKYCQKQVRDNYNMLDEKLIFSNDETNKKDFASRRLNYPLEQGSIDSYDKLISTLYTPEERHKLEWAIGAIVTGDSKHIQKFMVLYGEAGAGKSTILNIIQKLFEGYYSVFDARALGSTSNSFALEAFKTNPLVAIQHDGDLSKIEDNTRLNSLVSHEEMTVNEKFKSTYTSRFKCFLFMGTNKPVKITDGKSGLLRRLIDVSPSGKKLSRKEYDAVVKHIDFELGAIAWHCREVYLSNPNRYDDYVPMTMLGASNDFYNFMIDSYHVFIKEDGTTLKAAWEMYRTYCDEAKVPYPFSQRNFKEELKNYFWDFNERFATDDGARVRSYYSGFRVDKFDREMSSPKKEEPKPNLIKFNRTKSIFDTEYADCPAQYATEKGTPLQKWDKVKSKLSELDTSQIHYVMPPDNHIVIDFDLKDEDGNKSFKLNVEAASKWPATYAELSKSGEGVHLHYNYAGDPTKLNSIYDNNPNIEIKVFTGKSSLRRKLTKCNDLPIATISSGLPLKEEKKMVNFEGVKNEKHLRTMIKKNLNKEFQSSTRCSIDFINKLLSDAYEQGLSYDVSDMKNAVFAFAANSTNQSDYCMKLVSKMKFKSEEPSNFVDGPDQELVFYDIEVFPNLFLVNWKMQGEGKPVVRMINPKPDEIEGLLHYRLVGFNCRRYDNHILYARLMGYDNEQLYNLSQKIIAGEKGAFFGEAYNISYTDVYDFAATKQSLKKWEIELGIHHQELGLPWDQPVPEDRWVEVAEYCDNDVIATEATFNHLKGDWTARQILADVAGMSVNDTTNSLTTRIIFGKNRNPQSAFNYRDMGDHTQAQLPGMDGYIDEYTMFDLQNRPIFPGYKYEQGISTYRGEEVGEGGYVYAEPGVYTNIALLDIASMHPASIIAEQLFGPEFTKRFQEIRDARVAIKHKDFDTAREMLNGALAKYLDDESTAADLAQALKIAINSVYGLTAAGFSNPFRDPRNKDNIVAKRGALFMVNLKHEVQKRGFTVVHIKTDSIKIADATPEIIQFVSDYGQMYGYTFEHEATYEKICLVNNAVYIAKYKDGKHAGEWTATGTQFQVPYVFKTLFSREPLVFEDMCETKSVAKGTLYLDMNETLPDVSIYEKELEDRRKGKKRLNPELTELTEEDLLKVIETGHDYQFVGRVGQFCPIKPGCGGGVLYRVNDGKSYAATGTDGYRWLESEMVKLLGKEKDIDMTYYTRLADEARDAISEYGDFEQFISDDPVSDIPKFEAPPWKVACGKDTCEGCEHFTNDNYHFDCRLGHDIGDMIIFNQIEDEAEAFRKR